jgi:hypothetical protein
MASAKTSRPMCKSLVIGARKSPKLCRIPKTTLRIAPPQIITIHVFRFIDAPLNESID